MNWKDAKAGLDWWRQYFKWINTRWLKGEQKHKKDGSKRRRNDG